MHKKGHKSKRNQSFTFTVKLHVNTVIEGCKWRPNFYIKVNAIKINGKRYK